MIVSGTITQAGEPSEPTGQYQVRYQDVCITDLVGKEWYGRIGSKQGYQTNTPIIVTVEEKQDNDGTPYNYFRKHNPQYPQQQAAQPTPQRPRQAPQRAPQRPSPQQQAQNGKEMTKQDGEVKECRDHRAKCLGYAADLVINDKLDLEAMDSWVKAKVTFIWDGLVDRGGQPNPNYSEEPPPDDGIPF